MQQLYNVFVRIDGMNMKKNKIPHLAFAIVLVSFLLSTFVSLWSLNEMAQDNIEEFSKLMAARIYDTISSELSEPVVAARTMANDRFLIEMLQQEKHYTKEEAVSELQEYLVGMKDGLGYETAFVVSDLSKRYYSLKGLHKIIHPETDPHDVWYPEFLATGREYALDVDNDELGQDVWTVFVNTRIQGDEGKNLGVCGVGLRMTKSQELFLGLEKEYQVRIRLTTADGLVQVDTDESAIKNLVLDNLPIDAAHSTDYLYQRNGRDGYTVTRYIDRLGWYLVIRGIYGDTLTQYLNVILLNVILCIFVMLIFVLATRIIMIRTQALEKASFRDQTTSLLNRRAFEEEKARLLAEPESMNEDFVYVTADINGLKQANDHLGHAAGDELIKGAADCLKECFGSYGKIYRIGGDEFAAMLSVPSHQLQPLVQHLEDLTAGWTGEKVKALSISLGYVCYREFPSESITELSRISDERMYEAKESYYARTGNKRRLS